MGTLFRDLRRQFVSFTWMSGVFYLQTIYIQVSSFKDLDFFQHGDYSKNQKLVVGVNWFRILFRLCKPTRYVKAPLMHGLIFFMIYFSHLSKFHQLL